MGEQIVTLPPGYTLRPATVHDAALIQSQRTAMFTDMGSDPAKLLSLIHI